MRNDDCTQIESDNEADGVKYKKHIQAVIYKWWRKYDVGAEDTYSDNQYERNNSVAITSIILNPCQ